MNSDFFLQGSQSNKPSMSVKEYLRSRWDIGERLSGSMLVSMEADEVPKQIILEWLLRNGWGYGYEYGGVNKAGPFEGDPEDIPDDQKYVDGGSSGKLYLISTEEPKKLKTDYSKMKFLVGNSGKWEELGEFRSSVPMKFILDSNFMGPIRDLARYG